MTDAWILTRSLSVSDIIIEAVITNPAVTCADLEALAASVANQDGMASPWIPVILDLEAEMVLRGEQ